MTLPKMYASILACLLVSIAAPVVCLFYRKGWFNTPDDPVSPHGLYEPFMQKLHARMGTWFADWWWLGIRNTGYGLKYALKPAHFKSLNTYALCNVKKKYGKYLSITTVDGYSEYVIDIGWCHLIVGYRLSPIFDEVMKNRRGWKIPFRKVNMDARPIISLRGGAS